MFSRVSDPYNDAGNQIYGGGNPGLYGLGGYLSGGDIFGGKIRRKRRGHRPTAKQLRALAKGRAKLRTMRRMRGGAAKRRFKGTSLGIRGISQAGLDRAALETAKIINELKFKYGWGEGQGEQEIVPGVYKLVNRLNNLGNYVNRCTAMGLVPSYTGIKIPDNWWPVMAQAQQANVTSHISNTMGSLDVMNPAVRNLTRNLLSRTGQQSDPSAVTNAIRSYKQGMYNTMVSLPNYRPNVFG